METKQDALQYHEGWRPGKIEVVSTKPCLTQRDLSLAYTPGVADPCLEIAKNPSDVFRYTARGNLVAVVSNGTAVLGLGNIGALAGKPVMEGKGVLFKRFADIDVFDLELNTLSVEKMVETVKLLEPTFGGINLEDIAAPECFEVETRLIECMEIPVFHDDQHGTAIISGAAILNALELQKKDIGEIRMVISGAGAAGIACAKIYLALGMRKEQIVFVDTAGVIYRGREKKMNKYKEEFATDEKCRTLAEAMKGADVFVGLSGANIVSKEMVSSMADRPIVLAMANPNPEITYPEAKKARSDVIVATGRSDYPNQVNNVLGFPFIFRGALDVRSRAINMEMKLAASHALADLTKQSVPDSVSRAYGDSHFHFGPDYIIPKPFDPRVLIWEAGAVAKAAMETKVARNPVDLEEYREALESRLGKTREAMRSITHKARQNPKTIVYPEGTHPKILKAVAEVVEERIARPVLLGNQERIRTAALENDVPLDGVTIVDPLRSDRRERYAEELFTLRERKGVTREYAAQLVLDPNVFGALMVRMGEADGLISGVSQHYPDTIRPLLQIIGSRPDMPRVVGVMVITFRNKTYFLADATMNVEPDADCLADIAILASQLAKRFNVTPRVAMLSFSNFGSVNHPLVSLVQEATRKVRERAPDLAVDGEMQADTAVDPALARTHFPFSAIQGDANVLIFPDLTSSNIAYKLLRKLGGAESIGPVLMGMNLPVHGLHQSSEVVDIVNLTAIAVADSQDQEEQRKRMGLPGERPLLKRKAG
jgi:malate dehydrogenase (oxaloacetate-decarboxylating)(NADP+)